MNEAQEYGQLVNFDQNQSSDWQKKEIKSFSEKASIKPSACLGKEACNGDNHAVGKSATSLIGTPNKFFYQPFMPAVKSNTENPVFSDPIACTTCSLALCPKRKFLTDPNSGDEDHECGNSKKSKLEKSLETKWESQETNGQGMSSSVLILIDVFPTFLSIMCLLNF